MPSGTSCDVEIVELTESEAVAAFDRLAHREMGLSGDEFLQRWNAGQWDEVDVDDVPGLAEVSMALYLVR